MRTLPAFLTLPLMFCLTQAAVAQSASTPQAAAQEPSVAPVWDASKVVAAFADQAARLKPILEKLTPQQWVSQGAPQVYVTQWQNVRKELDYVGQSAQLFENDPERLTLALDTYFRWQRLASDLSSLTEGVRHYQNPAIGDLMVAVLGENTTNRDLLQQHITDLAAQKEQEFAVVDEEAQRCRSIVTRPPAPVRPSPPKPSAARPSAARPSSANPSSANPSSANPSPANPVAPKATPSNPQ